jgi:homoserine O-acetyltransferase
MAKLEAARVDASFFLLESGFGHSASGRDPDKWSPRLKAFMDRLMPARS